jgi:glycerophosphoryl diester phosphodiesterase
MSLLAARAASPRWGRQEVPLVIAHRGASTERPENSLAAFRRARELGADGVELDAMRCASGEVVVFHDEDLERLGGRPEEVRRAPLALLREVDLGGGERIPTLDEVLGDLAGDQLVNVELKSPERKGLGWLRVLGDDGLAAEVARLVARHALGARALVSSFDPILLARFRAASPHTPTGLLFHGELSRPLREAWAAPLIQPAALHPEAKLLDARSIARWRRGGRAVNVWTVDHPHEIALARALGADGIITNRPEVARRVLAQP